MPFITFLAARGAHARSVNPHCPEENDRAQYSAGWRGQCGEVINSQWRCTRKSRHVGPHVSSNGITVYARWLDDDAVNS